MELLKDIISLSRMNKDLLKNLRRSYLTDDRKEILDYIEQLIKYHSLNDTGQIYKVEKKSSLSKYEIRTLNPISYTLDNYVLEIICYSDRDRNDIITYYVGGDDLLKDHNIFISIYDAISRMNYLNNKDKINKEKE